MSTLKFQTITRSLIIFHIMISHLIVISLTVLFTSYFSLGQINSSFVEHLSKNQLQVEQWTYLNTTQSSQDSTHYYFSKYHLQYGQDSLFLLNVKKSPTLFFNDQMAVNYANNYFLSKENKFAQRWFSEVDQNSSELSGLPLIYHSAYHPNETDINTLPINLRGDFLRLQRSDRKRPFLAATFSAIIPGTGKLYIGSPRSFIITFVSLSILGLQTWESYTNLGVKHPLTILNGGLFSLYYATNIFGSFRETKTKKKNRRKQFLINASKQYHSTSPSILY